MRSLNIFSAMSSYFLVENVFCIHGSLYAGRYSQVFSFRLVSRDSQCGDLVTRHSDSIGRGVHVTDKNAQVSLNKQRLELCLPVSPSIKASHMR